MSLLSPPVANTDTVNHTVSSKRPVWFSALFAVMIFSLTAPFTTLALDAFTPAFIAFTRAMIAGIGSVVMMLYLKWPIPKFRDLLWLLVSGAAVALVFPFTLAQSLQYWEAKDMGVVLAGIPFFTAIIAAGLYREKTTLPFWLSLIAGTALLMLFAYGQSNGELHASLLLMLFSAGFGYAVGGHVAKRLGGFQTICWMMIVYLPVSVFGVGYNAIENVPHFNGEHTVAIVALVYLSVMSQWIGFHFWYGSMAKIGIAQTSQMQLLQPFFTLLFTVPLLASEITIVDCLFAALITASVWLVRHSR